MQGKFYPMTNDYMFKAVLQESEVALRGLLCSLLRLKPDDIKSIKIENPMELGKAVNDKEFYLDIKLTLNSNSIINLEMQVEAQEGWAERSLSYLCRSYDNLNRGSDYVEVKPSIHIGFINFNLFPNHPEFYATYKMRNVKDGYIYSDKFILSVVQLKSIDLATEEDRLYETDKWARLFSAASKEELMAVATGNEAMQDAANKSIFFNSDYFIQEQCRYREDEIALKNSLNNRIAKLEKEKAEWKKEKRALQKEKEALLKEIEQYKSRFSE